jgi:hypothetical protein
MSTPWFRRYAAFSYRPTTWQGRSVIAGMAVIAIPSGIAWLSYADTHPAFAFTAGVAALLSALIGHAVVLWKMDWNYPTP